MQYMSNGQLAKRMQAALEFHTYMAAAGRIKASGCAVTVEALAVECQMRLSRVRKYTRENPRRMVYLGVRAAEEKESVTIRTTPHEDLIQECGARYCRCANTLKKQGQPLSVEAVARAVGVPVWHVAAFVSANPRAIPLLVSQTEQATQDDAVAA